MVQAVHKSPHLNPEPISATTILVNRFTAVASGILASAAYFRFLAEMRTVFGLIDDTFDLRHHAPSCRSEGISKTVTTA